MIFRINKSPSITSLSGYISYQAYYSDYLIGDDDYLIDTGRAPHGHGYDWKKSTLKEQAIELSHVNSLELTYYELSILQAYFEKYGKRYGLLKEFKANGII